MGAATKIEWCDHTFNPWTGCTKISEGCAHCYAEGWAKRSGIVKWGAGQLRRLTSEANWKEPLKWNQAVRDIWEAKGCSTPGCGYPDGKPCIGCGLKVTKPRVFCASLADVLDDEVSVAWLARLLQLIHDTPNLNWLLLTKRPQNWTNRLRGAMPSMGGHLKARSMVESWLLGFPPKNVWMGTTVENQARAEERVPALLKIPATVRFLSCEPLLGAVDLTPYLHRSDSTKMCPLCGFATNRDTETNCPNDGALLGPDIAVDWVIAGGESGPGARPMHPAWARALRDQCQAAKVAFLFKQWGAFAPGFDEERFTYGGEEKKHHVWLTRDGTQDGCCWIRDDDATWQNWTGDPPVDADGHITDDVAVMHPCPKKEAGRLLEGREWSEFPKLAS